MIDSKLCVYCGVREATTFDHVPPKSIFPKPRPQDLVTVPACFECNNESSADDEEFRVFISIQSGHDQPMTDDLWRSGLIPTLRHNQRLRNSILGRSQDAEMRTPAGIFLGHMKAVPLRADPHKRVLRRIVCGLYYHHFGEPVEPTTLVEANLLVSLPEEFAEFLPDMSLARIGGDAFQYRYGRAGELSQASLWVIWFYRRYLVFAHTDPRERDHDPATIDVAAQPTISANEP
jgi:hypothetical protein